MKNLFTILTTVCLTLSVWAQQDRGFVHVATADNITASWTHINHPDLDGNPGANVLFSQRYNGVTNNHPTGMWYDGGRWTIFNEDGSPMPEGIEFNIYIPGDSEVAVHVANSSNTSGSDTQLSGYTDLDYLFYNTYYNPHSVYNPHVYGNDYMLSGNRVLFTETEVDIPNNAGFLVMKGSPLSAGMGGVASTSENIIGNALILDHPTLNNNPNAVFIYSHYYGFVGNNSVLPAVTEVEYHTSTGRWRIYAYGIAFPTGVWIDIIIPNTILGTNDVQAEVSKISLYPNPVTDIVNISSSKKEIQEVQIYDVTGKQVKAFMQSGKTVSVDVSALPSGMYIAKIRTDEGWFSQKLIKK